MKKAAWHRKQGAHQGVFSLRQIPKVSFESNCGTGSLGGEGVASCPAMAIGPAAGLAGTGKMAAQVGFVFLVKGGGLGDWGIGGLGIGDWGLGGGRVRQCRRRLTPSHACCEPYCSTAKCHTGSIAPSSVVGHEIQQTNLEPRGPYGSLKESRISSSMWQHPNVHIRPPEQGLSPRRTPD